MDVRMDPALESFRDEVRTWLDEHLVGGFAALKGRGGTGSEDINPEDLIAWERELAGGGWLGLGYPAELGGRPATLMEMVVFHSAYVESGAPGRMPNVGITLAGPTLLAFGTEAQQQRFIPPMLRGEEFWCQGYSEPNAGSDLANVSTKARLVDGQWVVNGQKVWTSLAQESQWAFVVARSEEGSERHQGLSYLLVPMDQPGIEIRPIVQVTAGTEFNEVFFTDAVTDEDLVVGGAGNGWKVAMGTLGFERGASTLGQQLGFRRELDELVVRAKTNGRYDDPVIRQNLTQAHIELEIMRFNNLRMLTVVDSGGVPGPEMSIGKLYWSNWHRRLGELMMDVMGAAGMVGGAEATKAHGSGPEYELNPLQRTFLYSRAHTIYAGSNEVQRNILGERVLGLPREPR